MSSPLGIVFAMEIDGRPTLAFAAKNTREASELCKEDWLRADLSVLTSNGIPLCTAAAELTVRRATESEMQIYRRPGGSSIWEPWLPALTDGRIPFVELSNQLD